jgi:amino acid transporter
LVEDKKDGSITESASSLKRVLGFRGLFVIAIGVVTAQSCFVSTLQGAGIGGAHFFIALLVGFILTLCYVSTYAELSLMMPKAGSISTYTAVAMGHFPAIVAAIAGYLAPIVFGGPAELLLVDYILDVAYPGVFAHVGLFLLITLTIFNLLGINIFSTIQNILTYSMLVALFIVGIAGFNNSSASGTSLHELTNQMSHIDTGVFSLIVLAIWAFLSIEFVCPLIEETKRPEKNIPRTMFAAAVVILVVHSLVAYAGMRQVATASLSDSDIPHWILVNKLFGNTGRLIISVITITTTAGFINTVLATLPKMFYGMAHHKQLPTMFMKIHPKFKSPWIGILFIAAAIFIPLLLLSKAKDVLITLVISSATIWLLTYIIAHINVIVLRKKYPHFSRPYKSALYPLPQIIGIIGMSFAIIKNAPSAELTVKVYTNTIVFVLITATYAFFWIKFKMKKALFQQEPIEKALRD